LDHNIMMVNAPLAVPPTKGETTLCVNVKQCALASKAEGNGRFCC